MTNIETVLVILLAVFVTFSLLGVVIGTINYRRAKANNHRRIKELREIRESIANIKQIIEESDLGK